MRFQPGRVHVASLIVLAVIGVGLLLLAERSKSPVEQRYFTEKMEAATRTRLAIQAVREARLGSGGPIDVVNDPNETGLIGPEFSLVTTDRGALDQKLRGLDPNLAAVLVDILRRADVDEGELVGVGCTGSFPVLNAAAVIAVETVGATPVIISSVGSSMWGATDPALTWLDMESVLLAQGVISHRSVAASIGGGDDRGRGLSPEGRALVAEAIVRNGVAPIEKQTLEGGISERMRIYRGAAGGKRYAAFVNVGGGLANVGSPQIGKLIRPGLSRRLEFENPPIRGVVLRMAERRVPVIHVPNPDPFIERYGLAAEPVPLPEVGTGEVFYQDRYNVPLAGILAVLYGFLIFVVVRIDLKHYLFRRPRA